MLEELRGRNGTGEFARRSIKNLDFILTSTASGADVHPVTQTITSLLAILVFPWERSAFNEIKKKRLPILYAEGWPRWAMSGPRTEKNKVKEIGDLIKLIRNSVSHGNVYFDSDSKQPDQVMIRFENVPENGAGPDWNASIRADRLVEFCRRFSGFVADYIS